MDKSVANYPTNPQHFKSVVKLNEVKKKAVLAGMRLHRNVSCVHD